MRKHQTEHLLQLCPSKAGAPLTKTVEVCIAGSAAHGKRMNTQKTVPDACMAEHPVGLRSQRQRIHESAAQNTLLTDHRPVYRDDRDAFPVTVKLTEMTASRP